MTVFGDMAFKEAIKLKWRHRMSINLIWLESLRGDQDPDTHRRIATWGHREKMLSTSPDHTSTLNFWLQSCERICCYHLRHSIWRTGYSSLSWLMGTRHKSDESPHWYMHTPWFFPPLISSHWGKLPLTLSFPEVPYIELSLHPQPKNILVWHVQPHSGCAMTRRGGKTGVLQML
jgi:hypothetical protein